MMQQRVGEISLFSSSTHQTLQPHRIDCPGGREGGGNGSYLEISLYYIIIVTFMKWSCA